MSKSIEDTATYILRIIAIIIFSFIGLVIIYLIIFLFSGATMFQNLHIKESDVKKQIEMERLALNKYKPVIDYIENYKSQNKTYPKKLPLKYNNITSDKLDGFEYQTGDGEHYIFRVFPKQGPIEYYEPKTLYKWRRGYKGIFDKLYYYNVNKDWGAIHYKYYTRYKDNWLDIDSCIDDSGNWDYKKHRCIMP